MLRRGYGVRPNAGPWLADGMYGQISRMFRSSSRSAAPAGPSLSAVLADARYSGGEILLPEGTYCLYSPLTIAADEIRIIGCGDGTVISLVDGAYVSWTGQYGELRDVRLVTPRTPPTHFLVVSGDRWRGRGLRLVGALNGVRLSGASCSLYDSSVESQAAIGIDSPGDFNRISGCRVDASPSATEILSAGAQNSVVHNFCIGGAVSVLGAGSTNFDNQV